MSHPHVTCDGCGESNFVGTRFKCTVCFDYDLCPNCQDAGITSKQHASDHLMSPIQPGASAFGTGGLFLGNDNGPTGGFGLFGEPQSLSPPSGRRGGGRGGRGGGGGRGRGARSVRGSSSGLNLSHSNGSRATLRRTYAGRYGGDASSGEEEEEVDSDLYDDGGEPLIDYVYAEELGLAEDDGGEGDDGARRPRRARRSRSRSASGSEESESDESDSSDEEDEEERQRHLVGSGGKVYTCPFCLAMGFPEALLVKHIVTRHDGDTTPVVCPICAALPGGDSNYVSRDYHGHLGLRHRADDYRRQPRKKATKRSPRIQIETAPQKRPQPKKQAEDSSDMLLWLTNHENKRAKQQKDSSSASSATTTTSTATTTETAAATGGNSDKAEKHRNDTMRALFMQQVVVSTLL